MPRRKDDLQQQIAGQMAVPTSEIELRIAEALLIGGRFSGELSSEELAPILSNVLYTLVQQQKVAGLDVPVVHNVNRMEVEIVKAQAHVLCELHLHAPIRAFIRFEYTLINDPHNRRNLCLKDGELRVKETTGRFDLAARAALRVMGVRQMAMHELRDPGDVIRRTLPYRLRQHGFETSLSDISLSLTQSSLSVQLSIDGS